MEWKSVQLKSLVLPNSPITSHRPGARQCSRGFLISYSQITASVNWAVTAILRIQKFCHATRNISVDISSRHTLQPPHRQRDEEAQADLPLLEWR